MRVIGGLEGGAVADHVSGVWCGQTFRAAHHGVGQLFGGDGAVLYKA